VLTRGEERSWSGQNPAGGGRPRWPAAASCGGGVIALLRRREAAHRLQLGEADAMVASIGSGCAPIGAHNGELCGGRRAHRLDFLQCGGALALRGRAGWRRLGRLPFIGGPLCPGGGTHAEPRGGGGAQQLCCLRPDGLRRARLGRSGLGRAHGLGPIRYDRFFSFSFSFFSEIFSGA
jgi:hypothetical protein